MASGFILGLAMLLAACGGSGDAPSEAAPDTSPPSMPAAVTATAVAPNQVVVTWAASSDASGGVAGYRVYRDDTSTAIATVNTNSFIDNGVVAGSLYSYAVRAFDAATPPNESALSMPGSVTTPAAPSIDAIAPTAPAGVTAGAQSPTQILLTWSASTDASGIGGYRIFRDGSATPVATVQVTSYSDNGVSAGTTHTYTVSAYDAADPPNESAPSAVVTVTTPAAPLVDFSPPTVPSGVTALAQSPTRIVVSWTASTDASGVAGYRIHRNGGATPLATVTGSSYTDDGLDAATTYSYTVVAFDAANPSNQSAASAAASAMTLAAPALDSTPPSVPANVVALAQSPTQILVSWAGSTDASGIGGYRVYRNGGGTEIATVATTSFTDNALAPATSYTYTVRAFDAASPSNQSAESAAVSATTFAAPIVDATPPTVPGNVMAAAQSASTILLTWVASTDASGIGGYRIFRNGAVAPLATVTTTSYLDSGLAAATAYSYTVLAFDAAPTPNASAESSPATATTPVAPVIDSTPPTAPAGLTATAQSATQILLSWNASSDGSGIGGYRIYRDAGGTPIATVQSTTYTDNGLSAGTTYSYTVRAFDSASPPNTSAASALASATTSGSGGVAGLDARPGNSSCLAGDAPVNDVSIAVQRVFPGLRFDQPVAMLQEPGNSARWYVAEKTGSVRVFANVGSASTTQEFIDLSSVIESSGEAGLLGMAFHPDYPANPRVYLFYTANDPGLGLVDRVSEFRTIDGGSTLSRSSELVLFNVDDPGTNHNGGNIAFGPDGFLYVGIGDGGGGGEFNSQNLRTMLGKMLRIDVSASNATNTYSIPPGNPFAGGARCHVNGNSSAANCPEIYAYGLRNPWRWSFDRGSGQLWLNDVGENAYEEVDLITIGGNYGWNCREGAHPYNNNSCAPNSTPIPPVAEYGRAQGSSTIGGVVYRGSSIPNLQGRYFFADSVSGNLWHIARDTTPTLTVGAGFATGTAVVSFAQDEDNEVYLVDIQGYLFKLVPGSGSGSGRQIPALLSQTGCVSSSDARQPATGLIPYAPNAGFFSDDASKTRWLALPDGQRIVVNGNDHLDFPVGSVLMKNFSIGTQLVETRLFMRHNDGNWAGYTYEWNAGGTDATRVTGGKTVQVAGQTWEFPGEAQCLQCHTAVAGRTLGLELGSLNGDFGYPTGRSANQLTTLGAIDALTPALVLPPAQQPLIPAPFGSASLTARARAYLHSNCAYCHQPGGPTPSDIDLRYTTPLANTHTCDEMPQNGDLGIINARRIAPGAATRSVVVARVNRLGAAAMPPVMRHRIDTAGVALLTEWVNGLGSCN